MIHSSTTKCQSAQAVRHIVLPFTLVSKITSPVQGAQAMELAVAPGSLVEDAARCDPDALDGLTVFPRARESTMKQLGEAAVV